MSFFEIMLIGVGLAMDAFAVSVCRGLRMRRIDCGYAAVTSLSFGLFQFLMPIVGWFVGARFASYIEKYDHFVAFGLLAFIGVKMIVEAVRGRGKEDGEENVDRIRWGELMILSIATSIDALAVGVTFAFEPELNVWAASAVIGIVTFVICCAGFLIGNKFGARFKTKAEIAGGVILVLIGLKIMLEGIGVTLFK